jgi:cell wall-associated NlpC family hydrolase
VRPLRWIPFYLLCSLAAPFAQADEFDTPDWRRYESSAVDRTFQPATALAARPTSLHRRMESAGISQLRERSTAIAQLRNEGKRRSSPVDTLRIVARAHELIGTPYRWGGQSEEDGFDCSGLLVYLYRSIADRKLPRTTASMIAQRHNQVDRDQLQPGDAVFFNHNGEGGTSHVGLYIGGDRFIHAPSTGKTIRIDSLDNSYWQRSYTTARRFSG